MGEMPTETLVELCDVRVRYSTPTGVSGGGPSGVAEVGIDVPECRIAAGARVAVLGPSGSGKSTLAALIGGYLPPEARVIGRKVRSVAKVGYVAQDSFAALNPLMRVDKQISLLGDPAVLAQVGLEPELAHRFPLELSGGQRQRAAIAFAVAGAPELLIADEVTSALDSVAIVEVLDTIRAVSEGKTVLFLSHHRQAMSYLCDAAIVMRPTADPGVFRAEMVEELPW